MNEQKAFAALTPRLLARKGGARPAMRPQLGMFNNFPTSAAPLDGGRRAAFTLRIDPDRHLQLRLACTLAGRSAQQLMTDALDRLISELPDVSALAAKARNSRN